MFRVNNYCVEIPDQVPLRVFDNVTEAEGYAKKLSRDYKLPIKSGAPAVGKNKDAVNFWEL